MDERDGFVAAVRAGLEAGGLDLDKPLLVAVSGGADSTALLLACVAMRDTIGLSISAAHFNHRLRGHQSDADVLWVTRLCSSHHVECVTGEADVAAASARRRLTMEEAGRLLRYDFLSRAAAGAQAQGVATGHTMDDQAETMLMSIVRGAGLDGLAGMQPRHVRPATSEAQPLVIYRPLLQIRRSDTERFCLSHGIAPLRDPSNENVEHTRNRLRLRVLPELAAVNPRVVETVSRLGQMAGTDSDYLEERVTDLWQAIAEPQPAGAVSLDRRGLSNQHPALIRRLLRRAYDHVHGSLEGLEHRHVSEMSALAAGAAGRSIDLPHGLRFEVGYERLTVARREAPSADGCPYPNALPESLLSVPGRLDLGEGRSITAAIAPAPADPSTEAPWCVYLDPAAVGTSVIVRPRRPGDRFQPLGMSQEKSLQDLMVDYRIPRAWRERVPIVDTPRGIAWVIGIRPAHWARLAEGVQQALRLAYEAPGRTA